MFVEEETWLNKSYQPVFKYNVCYINFIKDLISHSFLKWNVSKSF